MNSITFTTKDLFAAAVNTLALDESPSYEVDTAYLTIRSDDLPVIVNILHDNGIFNFVGNVSDEPFDGFRTDAEADADALASAGFGTDEDYGGCNDYGYDE
jgi:hypothetical protein